MGNGLIVCGLNGCGKSTLGKALAQELGFYFIDNEYLFFDRATANAPYANPRSHEEAEKIFEREVAEHEDFVFAAVTGNYGKDAHTLYRYAIFIETPKEIRIQRVKKRSFQKFGNRMLPGGDLYESEEAFFTFVENRSEDHVEKWVKALNCPVIQVDGTKSVEENIAYIKQYINRIEAQGMEDYFEYADKKQLEEILPNLFRLLGANMNAIAPTGNSYEEDYQMWFSNMVPAMQNPKRQIVLMYRREQLVGYFQYYIDSGVFMMEEIQIDKTCHGTGVFSAFFSWLVRRLPNDTESVEAYAHKKNKKSQGILEHMGLKQIGESKNGNSYHYKGNYKSLIEKFG